MCTLQRISLNLLTICYLTKELRHTRREFTIIHFLLCSLNGETIESHHLNCKISKNTKKSLHLVQKIVISQLKTIKQLHKKAKHFEKRKNRNDELTTFFCLNEFQINFFLHFLYVNCKTLSILFFSFFTRFLRVFHALN